MAGLLHVDIQIIQEYGNRYQIDTYKRADTTYFHTDQMIQTVLAHSHKVPDDVRKRHPVVKEYIMPLEKGKASFISSKGSKYDAKTKVSVLTALKHDSSFANRAALSKQYGVPAGTLSTWVHRYIVGGMILYGDKGEILFQITDVPSDNPQPEEEIEAFQIATNKNLPADEEEKYQAWVKIQFAKIAKAGLQKGKTLSHIYRQMTNIYGINWQQLYKQFYNHYGVRSGSTLRAVYFLQTHMAQGEYGNEHYENLFETLLDDYLNIKQTLGITL